MANTVETLLVQAQKAIKSRAPLAGRYANMPALRLLEEH